MQLFLMLFFVGILCLITLTDLYKQIIPNSCILAAILVRLLYYFVFETFQWETLFALIGNGLSMSLPMLILVMIMEKILKKEVMGGGDIKLLTCISVYLGFEQGLNLSILAIAIGAVISILTIAFLLCQKKEFQFSHLYIHFSLPIVLATLFINFHGGFIVWQIF